MQIQISFPLVIPGGTVCSQRHRKNVNSVEKPLLTSVKFSSEKLRYGCVIIPYF
jgi:hypothetical protein